MANTITGKEKDVIQSIFGQKNLQQKMLQMKKILEKSEEEI